MKTDDNINKANRQLSDKQTERPKLHHNEMVNYITPKLHKESNWGRPVINSNKKPKTQFNKRRKTGIGELEERFGITIANAGEGVTVVIMNTDDNINKANGQLSDKQTERPKLHHNEMVNHIIPKLPKESNWGRPVINSINCHVSEISRFVGHYLQPVAKEIPSYIKDRKLLCQKDQ